MTRAIFLKDVLVVKRLDENEFRLALDSMNLGLTRKEINAIMNYVSIRFTKLKMSRLKT